MCHTLERLALLQPSNFNLLSSEATGMCQHTSQRKLLCAPGNTDAAVVCRCVSVFFSLCVSVCLCISECKLLRAVYTCEKWTLGTRSPFLSLGLPEGEEKKSEQLRALRTLCP